MKNTRNDNRNCQRLQIKYFSQNQYQKQQFPRVKKNRHFTKFLPKNMRVGVKNPIYLETIVNQPLKIMINVNQYAGKKSD